MKVLLYFESEKLLAKSGIGRALDHQKRALTEMGLTIRLIRMIKITISYISIHTDSKAAVSSRRRVKWGNPSFIMHIRPKKIFATPCWFQSTRSIC